MTREPSPPVVSRRAVLAGGGLLGLGAVLAACFPENAPGTDPTTTPNTSATPTTEPPRAVEFTDGMLASFDAAVTEAFSVFSLVGAAVALFQGDQIVYNKGFGIRDVATGDAVTPNTVFRIGSNTKSMTALLLAKYVDEGLTTCDTRLVDLWPDFVGPTPALTDSLTLHQLMGMGSGIAEPETIEFFASGGTVDAAQLLETIPHLEVISTTIDDVYYYNNTLVAAAPYLVMLADGTGPAGLEERYATDLAALVFAPIGMDDAVCGADPRPARTDCATGYQRDLEQQLERSPFVSIGGYAPAGHVIASSTDMAKYLITQSRAGVAPGGTVVASAENVRRTHQPGVLVPPDSQNGLPSLLLADTDSTHYDLGWFDEEFTDGQRMLWHAGGIDGFGSLMGFLPDHGVGFVGLTNVEPGIGGLFNFSVQASFLDLLYGINGDIPGVLATVPPTSSTAQRDLLATTGPVDVAAVSPYLGLYSDGFTLALVGDELELRHDIRRLRMRAVDAATAVIVNGPGIVSGKAVAFATDDEGNRTLTVTGFEPEDWLSGDV